MFTQSYQTPYLSLMWKLLNNQIHGNFGNISDSPFKPEVEIYGQSLLNLKLKYTDSPFKPEVELYGTEFSF